MPVATCRRPGMTHVRQSGSVRLRASTGQTRVGAAPPEVERRHVQVSEPSGSRHSRFARASRRHRGGAGPYDAPLQAGDGPQSTRLAGEAVRPPPAGTRPAPRRAVRLREAPERDERRPETSREDSSAARTGGRRPGRSSQGRLDRTNATIRVPEHVDLVAGHARRPRRRPDSRSSAYARASLLRAAAATVDRQDGEARLEGRQHRRPPAMVGGCAVRQLQPAGPPARRDGDRGAVRETRTRLLVAWNAQRERNARLTQSHRVSTSALAARRYAARSANFAYRLRKLSLTASGRSVAVLGEDDLGEPLLVGLLAVVVLVAVDEDDEIRVLLDRAGLAQVGEDRPLVVTLLDARETAARGRGSARRGRVRAPSAGARSARPPGRGSRPMAPVVISWR